MESILLKGFLIGLLFGIPVGAVGALTVHRTLERGAWAGMVTGLGSSAADCLYACVGAFGLTLISDFLLNYQTAINIVGGSLILLMGVTMLVKKKKAVAVQTGATGSTKMFLSSFAVGITNPAAILTFLFAFSYFGIVGTMDISGGIQLVLGVLLGTLLWWCVLVAAADLLKRKKGQGGFKHMNKVFGVVLILFGTVVFVRTMH